MHCILLVAGVGPTDAGLSITEITMTYIKSLMTKQMHIKPSALERFSAAGMRWVRVLILEEETF